MIPDLSLVVEKSSSDNDGSVNEPRLASPFIIWFRLQSGKMGFGCYITIDIYLINKMDKHTFTSKCCFFEGSVYFPVLSSNDLETI
jgi:hypothetical protein